MLSQIKENSYSQKIKAFFVNMTKSFPLHKYSQQNF